MAHFRLVLLLMLTFLAMVPDSETRASQTNSDGSMLLVANKGEHTVGFIDPQSGRQVATVEAGGITPHELVASPDGRFAYAPIYGNSGVGLPGTDGSNLVVIDLATRKVVGNVDFGHGVRPHCPLIGPKDGLLYVTSELDKSVTIIDPRTLKIVGSVSTGQPESHMLALSRDGRRGYTANVGPGTISVLDLEARKLITVIEVAPHVQRIGLSVDDRWLFTADQSKPQLAVIDTVSNQLKTWIPLPGVGYGATPTPDGHWLVVPLRSADQVAVVDLNTMKVAHTIKVPPAPQEALVRPDGAIAYVSCDASRKVAAIRTSDWAVDQVMDAGAGVDGLAWAAPK
jgi:YVTN family beta-propeller protein